MTKNQKIKELESRIAELESKVEGFEIPKFMNKSQSAVQEIANEVIEDEYNEAIEQIAKDMFKNGSLQSKITDFVNEEPEEVEEEEIAVEEITRPAKAPKVAKKKATKKVAKAPKKAVAKTIAKPVAKKAPTSAVAKVHRDATDTPLQEYFYRLTNDNNGNAVKVKARGYIYEWNGTQIGVSRKTIANNKCIKDDSDQKWTLTDLTLGVKIGKCAKLDQVQECLDSVAERLSAIYADKKQLKGYKDLLANAEVMA